MTCLAPSLLTFASPNT